MTKLRKYGTATTLLMPMIKAGSIDFAVSGDWTPAAGDVKVSKDDGAFANIATLPTAVGNMWKFTLSATEMQCARLVVQVVDSATKAVEDQAFDIDTYGNASASIEFDLDNATPTVDVTSLGGSAQSATDLKDFADAGYDPATNKVQGVVLVDTLPTMPANWLTASGLATDAVTEIQSGLATAAALTTVDTVVDAIKAITDQFVFTVANQVDANALTGGGGLDAAGVRAAVGLASADLDTQLGGLSTHSAADVLTAFGTGSALSALTTAVGFSTHSAADVLTAFGTGSALSACLTATGFSTHDAAAVVTALGTGGTLTECLTATGFSTHSAADVLTAFGTGSALSALTTAVGFSTHDAAAVVTALGDGSTLTTCATATGFATPTNVTDAQTAIIVEVDANEVKIDAVKAITDQFVFTVANQVDANALTGGGGLDAAGVRSAVGLAAANLDTQLSDIPTVTEFNARTTTNPASTTNITAGTITTVTNLTNLPLITTDWITDAGISANAIAAIQHGVSEHNAADVVTALGDGSTLTACLTGGGGGGDATEAKQDTLISLIGTPAADVSADIAAIPTVGEIDTELTSSHGAGSWAAAGAGSGGSVVTITVDDGTNPLENATVRIYEGANNYVSTTGADGVISPTMGVDDATHNVVITKAGYTFSPTTLLVSGNTSQTYSMTAVAGPSTPASPSLCTLGTYLFSGATAVEGGTFKAHLLSPNSSVDTAVLSLQIVSDTTDANGYAELQLVRADQFTDNSPGIYQITVSDASGVVCTDVQITVPNVATALLEDYLP